MVDIVNHEDKWSAVGMTDEMPADHGKQVDSLNPADTFREQVGEGPERKGSGRLGGDDQFHVGIDGTGYLTYEPGLSDTGLTCNENARPVWIRHDETEECLLLGSTPHHPSVHVRILPRIARQTPKRTPWSTEFLRPEGQLKKISSHH